MTFDLCVWKAPRDVDTARATAIVGSWETAIADGSPLEPSTDVGWFYRELLKDFPNIDARSDIPPNRSRTPIVLASDDQPPARLVAMRLTPGDESSQVDSIFGLATKYDLVLFDARSGRVHLPMQEMAAYASATFWPRGAIQAAVAGGLGGVIGFAAWLAGIPVISGVVAVAGAFMLAMAVYSFVHEGRKALERRRP